MSDAPKEIVEQAYDHIAEWYLRWVQEHRSPRERYTNKALEIAPTCPRVLELGCGSGLPITRMLLERGAQVVANDISSRQLSMAKARCPQATFVPGNMAALSFDRASFDVVLSFYTIFHLPRVEQKGLLSNIYSWLKPGGVCVFNLATLDEEEIHGEFFGHGMFWSSYSVEDSIDMVRDTGLEVLEADVLEAGDGQLEKDDPDYGAKFLWVVTKKRLGQQDEQ